ncbi:DUF1656 domain-containing protein [Corallococcus sp. CA049B]|uniref:DUF1656 domain-containing protein n=1 Tax=Corallococcus sp. CA049B TaxID=2316730 RepID=UPI000EA38275|nr:DUF1656 domain-containing protein [Corallococcus sp. CA049B]NOJ96935.1 DUF1656 domain-containing protein [Corallococcus coralloides]RKG88738.1 DUF1656 domain-containing protein [Corallococcus sp. CA049B]
MRGELDVQGVFVPTLLVWALVAVALGVPLRRGLSALHVYRWVWHPALFDLALFVLLWFAVTFIASRVP